MNEIEGYFELRVPPSSPIFHLCPPQGVVEPVVYNLLHQSAVFQNGRQGDTVTRDHLHIIIITTTTVEETNGPLPWPYGIPPPSGHHPLGSAHRPPPRPPPRKKSHLLVVTNWCGGPPQPSLVGRLLDRTDVSSARCSATAPEPLPNSNSAGSAASVIFFFTPHPAHHLFF